MRISDWSSDVCSSDRLVAVFRGKILHGLGIDVGRVADNKPVLAMRQLLEEVAAVRGDASVEAKLFDIDIGDCQRLLRDVDRIDLRVFKGQGRQYGQAPRPGAQIQRSEEHTSELQSLMRISYAVFCLKKKK